MVTVSLVFLLKQNVSYQNGIAIAIGRIICNLELAVYIYTMTICLDWKQARLLKKVESLSITDFDAVENKFV